MQALVSETFGVHPLGSLHRGPPGAAQQVGWSGSRKCTAVTEALPSSLQTGVAVALSGSRSFVVEMGLQRISHCLALPVGAPSWQGPSVLGSCSFWYFTVTGHHETDGSCAQMMAGSVWVSVRGIGLQATAGPHHPDAVFGVGRGGGQQPQGRAFGNICPLLCPPAVWSQALRSKAPTACLTAVYTLTDLGTEAGPAGGGTVSACQMHTPLSV